MKTVKKGKFKIVFSCLYILVLMCILYNLLYVMNTLITKKDYLKLFGISFLCVENDLMEDDIAKYDLLIVKDVNDNDLYVGDVVAYEINGQIRINKIIDTDKENMYTTKFNKSYYPDAEKIKIEQIIGKKVNNISFWGGVFKILQTKLAGFFTFLVLVIIFCYNKYRYTKREERVARKKKIKEIERNKDIIY